METRQHVIDDERMALLSLGHYFVGALHFAFASMFLLHLYILVASLVDRNGRQLRGRGRDRGRAHDFRGAVHFRPPPPKIRHDHDLGNDPPRGEVT